MPSLPALDVKTNTNHSPHVVILGAGASLAACPKGDANGRKLPLMNNLVEIVELEEILQRYRINPNIENFESFYDEVASSGQYEDLISDIEKAVYSYFLKLRLPDEPTLYDYLILSLREKDLIASFNWDPFLAQAFIRNRHLTKLPRICFLHGNVEIGACVEHRRKGFISQICSECGERLSPSKLLYPVQHKDYESDPLISNEWKELTACLEHAYFVTIFGYSAPTTDVAARSLMLEVWNTNPTRELAEIDIVDIRPEKEIKKNWDEFIVRQHYGIWDDIFQTYLFRHPRRSCDAFAMATLQQAPWKNNHWPRFSTLSEMQRWIQPLLEEEANEYLTGNPCSTG